MSGSSTWSERSSVRTSEPMNAAEAWREARLRLRPPKELGREAFSHCQSGMGQPTISDRVSRIRLSKLEQACWMYIGGQVLREKESLGRARQDLRRAISICESSRSVRLDR